MLRQSHPKKKGSKNANLRRKKTQLKVLYRVEEKKKVFVKCLNGIHFGCGCRQ